MNDVQANAAKAEHRDIVAGLNLGRIGHRADTRGHAAADIADLVEGSVLANFRHRNFRQNGEIREGRAAHIMVDCLALIGKTRGAVRHHTLALGRADRRAEIGFLARAGLTLTAFRRVERDDMIAFLEAGYTGANLPDDACAFVAENTRKQAFAVQSIQRVGIGMANTGRHEFDQDFTVLRPIQVELDNFQGLLGFKRHSRACFHLVLPSQITPNKRVYSGELNP